MKSRRLAALAAAVLAAMTVACAGDNGGSEPQPDTESEAGY